MMKSFARKKTSVNTTEISMCREHNISMVLYCITNMNIEIPFLTLVTGHLQQEGSAETVWRVLR